jgi:hypothetical protein
MVDGCHIPALLQVGWEGVKEENGGGILHCTV